MSRDRSHGNATVAALVGCSAGHRNLLTLFLYLGIH